MVGIGINGMADHLLIMKRLVAAWAQALARMEQVVVIHT
jgi:hypothetical protein